MRIPSRQVTTAPSRPPTRARTAPGAAAAPDQPAGDRGEHADDQRDDHEPAVGGDVLLRLRDDRQRAARLVDRGTPAAARDAPRAGRARRRPRPARRSRQRGHPFAVSRAARTGPGASGGIPSRAGTAGRRATRTGPRPARRRTPPPGPRPPHRRTPRRTRDLPTGVRPRRPPGSRTTPPAGRGPGRAGCRRRPQRRDGRRQRRRDPGSPGRADPSGIGGRGGRVLTPGGVVSGGPLTNPVCQARLRGVPGAARHTRPRAVAATRRARPAGRCCSSTAAAGSPALQPAGPQPHPGHRGRCLGRRPQRAEPAEPGVREPVQLPRVDPGPGAGVAEVGAVDQPHAGPVQRGRVGAAAARPEPPEKNVCSVETTGIPAAATRSTSASGSGSTGVWASSSTPASSTRPTASAVSACATTLQPGAVRGLHHRPQHRGRRHRPGPLRPPLDRDLDQVHPVAGQARVRPGGPARAWSGRRRTRSRPRLRDGYPPVAVRIGPATPTYGIAGRRRPVPGPPAQAHPDAARRGRARRRPRRAAPPRPCRTPGARGRR